MFRKYGDDQGYNPEFASFSSFGVENSAAFRPQSLEVRGNLPRKTRESIE